MYINERNTEKVIENRERWKDTYTAHKSSNKERYAIN